MMAFPFLVRSSSLDDRAEVLGGQVVRITRVATPCIRGSASAAAARAGRCRWQPPGRPWSLVHTSLVPIRNSIGAPTTGWPPPVSVTLSRPIGSPSGISLTSAGSVLSDVTSWPTFTATGADVLAANTAVPEYSARIAWLPAPRSLRLTVATALLPGPAATGTVAMVVVAAHERHGAARSAGGADGRGDLGAERPPSGRTSWTWAGRQRGVAVATLDTLCVDRARAGREVHVAGVQRPHLVVTGQQVGDGLAGRLAVAVQLHGVAERLPVERRTARSRPGEPVPICCDDDGRREGHALADVAARRRRREVHVDTRCGHGLGEDVTAARVARSPA